MIRSHRLLVLLLVCVWAFSPAMGWAAAYTSAQNGNWSDDATWTGSGVPGNGDTVTRSHNITVDVNTTIGTDAASTNAMAGAAGTLTIPNGVTLTVKGLDVCTGTANLVIDVGGIYEGYTATNLYYIRYSGTIVNNGLMKSSTANANNFYLGGNATDRNRMSGTGEFRDIGTTSNHNVISSPVDLVGMQFTPH